ncbi:2OG-Fe(II) oxygenase [Methylophaga sp. OBS4]|uniref:2OG-Fe(II) oxygenase n=1 Tax=Methylophaga sp. OBS4 TaxID=2991935 RepID=UPI00224F6E2F|nr:2OG-Fe(II) oxygenase [Methylophaga sp. OBS4]MCX4187897.1 2OG-Fe(II) oxygenase [Methylophaga sp. OBS4]
MKPLIQPAESIYDEIADKLASQGYCILPQLLPAVLTNALHRRVINMDDDDFRQAGIGRELQFQLNQTVRQDQIRWLNQQQPVDAQYLAQMADFRLAINRRLFMGLFDYEAHYAFYAPGAFYKKHFDAFKGQSNRVLTTVLYLNQDWQAADGGQLLLYSPDGNKVIEQINPDFGSFVIFLSEQFPHEVVKSACDRYSIAGWFRLHDPLQAPSL